MEEVKQEIGESVKVVASFAPQKIAVHFFDWRGRTYKVESTNLFHIARDGEKKLYHLSISAGGNAYELVFDPTTLNWSLESICSL